MPFILVLLSVLPARGQRISYAAVEEDNYWKIVDSAGHTLADSLFARETTSDLYARFGNDLRPAFAEGLFPCKRNGLWGFKNLRNELAVPCVYSEVSGFYKGCARVAVNKTWGVIDRQGRLVAPLEYEYISGPDSTGMILLVKNGVMGAIDTTGKNMLPFVYKADPDLLPPVFSEGLLPIGYAKEQSSRLVFKPSYGKYGFIDRKGRLVIDTTYYFGAVVGNWAAERRYCPGCCGTGRSRMQMPPMENPYYVNGDYFRFEGGRCLVPHSGRPTVINAKGDSLFTLPPRSRGIVNAGGRIIFYIEPVNDGLAQLLGAALHSRPEDSMFRSGGYYMYGPDGVLQLTDCRSIARDGQQISYVKSDGTTGRVPLRENDINVPEKDQRWFWETGAQGQTLFGYKSAAGKMLIPPRFRNYTDFQEAVVQ